MSPSRLAGTVGWGLFCACSWTWCIGMFLPKPVVERYGWLGFLAFAAPNVIGCTAFGYVLDARASRSMMERHHGAMGWFSAITIGYHAAFMPILAATFLLPLPGELATAGPITGGLALTIVVIATGYAVSFLGDRARLVAAVLTYAVSITAVATWGLVPLRDVGWTGPEPTAGLAWFAPIIAVGFMLCPYLDLTFHRARQATPSRHAFAVFGAAFALMIVFTVAYASALELSALVLVHVLVQSTFTVGAHLRELRRLEPRPALARAALPYAIIAGALAWPVLDRFPGAEPVDAYLRILVFYGLVFPLYVLVFIGPWRPAPRDARSLWTYALATVAMLPFFELSFIHGRPWAMGVPLAALIAFVLARAARSASTGALTARGGA